jgi:hypothetical protein
LTFQEGSHGIFSIFGWNCPGPKVLAAAVTENPRFAMVAILTLALGIGANAAVFSVMNAVMLRYLPVPNPQQLVLLHYTDQPENSGQTGYDDTSLSEPVFASLRKQSDVFSDLVAFVPLGIPKIAVRIGDDPEEAAVDEVTGNFFSGLGVKIARGRRFAVSDETAHAQLAVLSYQYWTSRFGRNPSTLGQTIFVKGVPSQSWVWPPPNSRAWNAGRRLICGSRFRSTRSSSRGARPRRRSRRSTAVLSGFFS